MVFQLARTFAKPAAQPQRGFPAPGAGAQTSGDFTPAPRDTGWGSSRPTKGKRTFFAPAAPQDAQRGFASPADPSQGREGWGPGPVASGLPEWMPTQQQSYGAGRVAPRYGKVLTNPIGAGVVALHRPQASYGPAAQYVNGAIWWTSQAVPTTVNLQGLTDPAALAAILGPINVQAVVRTTG